MCLLIGRLASWFGYTQNGKGAIKNSNTVTTDTSTAEIAKITCDGKNNDFNARCANMTDEELISLTEESLKSLEGKLEIVLKAKANIDGLFTWIFPIWLSQSRLENRPQSNACTLITLTMAASFYSNEINSDCFVLMNNTKGLTPEEALCMVFYKVCPMELIRLLKEGILVGNRIYDTERLRGDKSVMFAGASKPLKEIITIPEAILARNRFFMGGSGSAEEKIKISRMFEIDYIAVYGSIRKNLMKAVNTAINHDDFAQWKVMCFILICCEKAVLLVYRRDSDLLGLVDSHAHANSHGKFESGSAIAVCKRSKMENLATFMDERIFPTHRYRLNPKFELSLVQYIGRGCVNPSTRPTKKIIFRNMTNALARPAPISLKMKKKTVTEEYDSGYDSDEKNTSI